MYMVRHSTQLPVPLSMIAKAEGISLSQLTKIFHLLTEAGFVARSDNGRSGYSFARPPHELTLLELFELIEGHTLFGECFMKHCDCGGTLENCDIYEQWHQATRSISKKLAETTIQDAAWRHPEHYFSKP
jgi:Rrf2 family protein